MYPFSSHQLLLLIPGLLCMIASFVQFSTGKQKGAYYLLITGATLLWLLSASLDHFLNPWDERFHALVAKNMMHDFLKPVIYSREYPGVDHQIWSSSHVWLHKQPLFTWQIALSYLVFGISEFSTRIPSVVMLLVTLIAIYNSAKLLINEKVAYLASLLFASNYYFHSMVSGQQGMDHNDIAFIAYISLSIWAWLEFRESDKLKWAVLTGLFSGAAIMCKWLAGLAVYLPWIVVMVSEKKIKKNIRPFLTALFFTMIVVLPWMVFTIIKYPATSAYEIKYHSRHFAEVLETHGGTFTFYIEQFIPVYGIINALLFLAGLLFFYRQSRRKNNATALILLMFFIYLFFSIAKTKLPGYVLPAQLIIFIIAGTTLLVLIELANKIKNYSLRISCVMILIGVVSWYSLSPIRLAKEHHPVKSEFCVGQLSNKNALLKLGAALPSDAFLFNLPGRTYIDMMFYTGITSFGFIPDQVALQKFKQLNHPLYILNDSLNASGMEVVYGDVKWNE